MRRAAVGEALDASRPRRARDARAARDASGPGAGRATRSRRAVALRAPLIATVLAAAACSACSKDRPPAPDAGATRPGATVAPVAAAPSGLSADEGRALVRGACLSCHSEEMLAQQRLTHAQWTKTVTKMVAWGANLEPKDTAPLTDWLAATYGPDAGAYEPAPIDVDAAAAELAPLPDGPYADGDAERGRALYTDRCSGCHGPEARGHIGVLLVDRPFLYRAPDVAETIRRGRGKMAPMTMSDAEIADVLAHLRALR
ncbi:MAG: cytochrome c [Labilithrix sp.]|nr:cytochrome c [Labilithrix sp.]